MSLKLVSFESLGAVSYSPSIVTVAVSLAVCAHVTSRGSSCVVLLIYRPGGCAVETLMRVRVRDLSNGVTSDFKVTIFFHIKQVYRRRYESRRSSKPKLHFKKQKKNKIWRFSIWRMEFLHPAMWNDRDIDFATWLHPAIWHVALDSWQWIHQVAAPYNVIRDSGMTCHWIRPNVRHIAILEFYIWFGFRPHHRSWYVILHQSPKFYPNRTNIGRKKLRHVDFQDGGSQPSWILEIQ